VVQEPDPLGGSIYIEQLTNEIERGAEDYIRRVDQMGGALFAIENGFMQGEIQNAAYERQRKVESGRAIVVGVNRFQQQSSAPPVMFRMDLDIERR